MAERTDFTQKKLKLIRFSDLWSKQSWLILQHLCQFSKSVSQEVSFLTMNWSTAQFNTEPSVYSYSLINTS